MDVMQKSCTNVRCKVRNHGNRWRSELKLELSEKFKWTAILDYVFESFKEKRV